MAKGALLAIAGGLLVAVPTSLTGLLDWADLSKGSRARTLANYHLVVMLLATATSPRPSSCSAPATSTPRSRSTGLIAGCAALGLLTLGGTLGGALAYVYGVRVVKRDVPLADALIPGRLEESAARHGRTSAAPLQAGASARRPTSSGRRAGAPDVVLPPRPPGAAPPTRERMAEYERRIIGRALSSARLTAGIDVSGCSRRSCRTWTPISQRSTNASARAAADDGRPAAARQRRAAHRRPPRGHDDPRPERRGAPPARLADGSRTRGEIFAAMAPDFPHFGERDVDEAVDELEAMGLLQDAAPRGRILSSRMSRRDPHERGLLAGPALVARRRARAATRRSAAHERADRADRAAAREPRRAAADTRSASGVAVAASTLGALRRHRGDRAGDHRRRHRRARPAMRSPVSKPSSGRLRNVLTTLTPGAQQSTHEPMFAEVRLHPVRSIPGADRPRRPRRRPRTPPASSAPTRRRCPRPRRHGRQRQRPERLLQRDGWHVVERLQAERAVDDVRVHAVSSSAPATARSSAAPTASVEQAPRDDRRARRAARDDAADVRAVAGRGVARAVMVLVDDLLVAV